VLTVVFGVYHVGGDMTGFEEEVSLSTLIVKPKKSQCGCGVVWWDSNPMLVCGMLCTDFIILTSDDDDNAAFSSPSRILSFVGLSILQV